MTRRFFQRLALACALAPLALPAQDAPPADNPPPAPAPVSPGAAKLFNPDIAVIGNFLAFGGNRGIAEDYVDPPAMQVKESEFSFQAVVDPYARADFFVSLTGGGIELEEGFLTFTRLPSGLTAKVGKFKAAFGKVNTMHAHVLPWADTPLAFAHFMGGEEGLKDGGVSMSWLAPTDSLFVELTGQALNGNDGALFTRFERRDLSYVGHVKVYGDLSDSQNLEGGLSVAYGNGDPLARAPKRRYGADLTWRWRPPQRSNYRQLMVRNEWFIAGRTPLDPLDRLSPRRLPVGAYLSADYRFARRWWAGVRYDYAPRPEAPAWQDRQSSATLTFWPSEFQQIRLQARRTWNDELRRNENSVLLQFQFAIGAHGAHPF